MSDYFIPFILFLLVIASVAGDSFAFTLFYLFAGVYILSRWWSGRALKQVRLTRSFTNRAFPGEKVAVQLEVDNTGWLPLPWLQLRESLPWELREGPPFQQVASLGGRGRLKLGYDLRALRRGIYPVGPLFISSGDLLGLAGEQQFQSAVDTLIVYPRVVPLGSVRLPSRLPVGTLRRRQSILDDPTRPTGKRDYTAGDSLRRVDWKATAAVGRLQVRQFEPSMDLETAIFLNLNLDEYHERLWIDATELAISAAASLAGWAAGRKQAVGLWCSGTDPLSPDGRAQPLPPRKGGSHLMGILEQLARIQAVKPRPFAQFLGENRAQLNWGATLVLVTGQTDDRLFDELFQARRAGLSPALVVCGLVDGFALSRQRAEHFGIPAYSLLNGRDLEGWQVV